jgi:hypothetical protein
MLLERYKLLFKVGAAAAVLAAGAWANNHHALNGTWKLIPARSEFGGEPAIQTGTITINDRERNITVSRNFTFDGANQTVSYSSSLDGKVNASIHEGPAFKTKAKWDGDVLTVTSTQDGITTVERYRLTNDGLMLLTVDRSGHRTETLTFERE